MKRFSLISLTLLLIACRPAVSQDAEIIQDVRATLRSASFVTHDLEASAEFYKDYLGYRELGRSEITAEKSRQVVGASGAVDVGYISLVPADWSKDNPEHAGVSFVGIPNAQGPAYAANGARQARSGEIILAHRVTNIIEIEHRMRKAGVIFVAPLGLSGSGKSQSMAVLDPNGNRVEMYEY